MEYTFVKMKSHLRCLRVSSTVKSKNVPLSESFVKSHRSFAQTERRGGGDDFGCIRQRGECAAPRVPLLQSAVPEAGTSSAPTSIRLSHRFGTRRAAQAERRRCTMVALPKPSCRECMKNQKNPPAEKT